MRRSLIAGSLLAVVVVFAQRAQAQDPLPSWNESPRKAAILDFVAKVTTDGGADFVPPELRIATFDNDGTLWCEQPMYAQLAFAIHQVEVVAPNHPDWKDKEPFKSVLAGDLAKALAGGEHAFVELVGATHSGMTTGEFNASVAAWLETARHPRFHRPYNRCIYQPMLELLAYLRAHGFKTFIVSGGGIEFMRVWAQGSYGIPPEQVVGSVGKLKYEVRNGKPCLIKLPEVQFVDDKSGKPIGIQEFIGLRPIAAFGNSDGDFEMLEWTTTPQGPDDGLRLGMIVHHTDAVREYAYDRDSKIGTLVRGLDEAAKRGWQVIDMKDDWKLIFPAE